ncbi:hypothetical protein CN378_06000 [Bacillus sp. AFS015802]|nr:hypothetical protein CN378_06000 [Bacillus sp. AFS015802]
MTSSSAVSDLESTPTARAERRNFGESCGAGFASRNPSRAVRKSVGEVVKKEDRSADRTGSGSSGKASREMDLESDSVDDARRLYVKKSSFVRTKCELKKAGKTTERRKAPRSLDG